MSNYGRVHRNVTCYSKRQKGNVYYSQTKSTTLIKFNSWNLTGMVCSCFTVIPAFILLQCSFFYHLGAQKSKWYLYLLFLAATPKWTKSCRQGEHGEFLSIHSSARPSFHLFVYSSIPLGLPKSKSGLWGPPLTLPPHRPSSSLRGQIWGSDAIFGDHREGWTDRQMDEWMDGWMDGQMYGPEFPLCSTRLCPLWGCCPTFFWLQQT